MKKVFVTIALAILVIVSASAQTQSGYVKTKGRMDKSGNLIPGTRIGGAAITLTGGHSTVADANGDFTLAVPDKKFFLKSVQKQGYVLVDPEVLSKQYVLSPNPLVFTMVTPKQQLEDQIEAQKKIEATLREQLVQREKDLEALKKAHKLTEEDYYRKLQQLYDEKATQELVKEMSKRYSEIDYDLIDSFQRQFSTYILNGELAKADSLLKTKGNLTGDIKELHRLETANAVERVELERRRARLDSSISYAQWLMEDIAMRCENKAEIFKLRYMNDSAAYYLELRAGLDTTNVEWLLEAGNIMKEKVLNYEKALRYYQIALRQAIMQYGTYDIFVAYSYEAIGDVFFKDLGYEGAEGYFNRENYLRIYENYAKALEIYTEIFKEGHALIARSYHNLSTVNYFFAIENIALYNQALFYALKGLEEDVKVYGEKSRKVAVDYFNLASNYEEKGAMERASDFYNKAINTLKSHLQSLSDVEKNGSEGAVCYGLLGDMYGSIFHSDIDNTEYYGMSIEYYSIALDLYKNMYGDSCIQRADIYDEMSQKYWDLEEYSKSIDCLQRKLKIYQYLYGNDHLRVADIYRDISGMYLGMDSIDLALKYSLKELGVLTNVYDDLNQKIIISSCCRVGDMYMFLENYSEAEKYCLKALEIQKNISGEKSIEYANMIVKLGTIFILGDKSKSLMYYNKALDAYKEIVGENHLRVGYLYASIADIYYRMDDYSNSFDYQLKSLLVHKRIYEADTSSDDARNSLGGQYVGVAYCAGKFGDYKKAIKYYQEGIDFYQRIHREDNWHSVTCYMYLGRLYMQNGNFSKALVCYKRLLAILQKSDRNVIDEILDCYKEICSVFISNGDITKAKEYYQKALAFIKLVYGEDHPKTQQIVDDFVWTRRMMILQSPVAMRQHIFTVTIIDGETPAKAQGLSGEYVVLEYGDWSIDSTSSLYDVNYEMRGKPKTILIMKDDMISQHSFENTIGAMIELKQVGEKEKKRIKKLYHQWRKKR